MTDHPASADQSPETPLPRGKPESGGAESAVPDYDLPDALSLQDPAQYRALFEETRQRIVSLLSERAATVTELAAAMGRPKGTIGHHMQVLAEAGLVHVVRTEKVRALEAKYWGRTARIFFYQRIDAAAGEGQRQLERAAAEVGQLEAAARATGQEFPGVLDVNRRDVRVPAERAQEFRTRLAQLLVEFAEQPRGGDTTYALVFGIFPSQLLPLPGRDAASS